MDGSPPTKETIGDNMRLVHYEDKSGHKVIPDWGLLIKDYIYPLNYLAPDAKGNIMDRVGYIYANNRFEPTENTTEKIAVKDATLLNPHSEPASIRDFYAFEQHVKTANENRGRDVPKQWYEIPVFYFTNHTAIFDPDDVIPYPVGSEKLDYELEVAAVIGKARYAISK